MIASAMAGPPLESIPDVCEVALARGREARDGFPALLLEVSHGATAARHFERLRAALRGPFPDDLAAFFFVNTDVGAPELAQRVAERVVAADPRRSAVVLRCLIPRTFVDCNRLLDEHTAPSRSAAGEVTPGLPEYVRDAGDLALLLGRYRAYRRLAETAFERVCGSGGLALMVHSYAPRSVDVPVDEHIVERLRAAYQPGQRERWPLRPPVDLIARDPDGALLAGEELLARVRAAFVAAGLEPTENGCYPLHPSTLAHTFAVRHPGRTLCLELRRDLLVGAFTPFREMAVDPAAVDRVAAPLADAVAASWASSE